MTSSGTHPVKASAESISWRVLLIRSERGSKQKRGGRVVDLELDR